MGTFNAPIFFHVMEKEIDWVDAVRALCILMVFFAHSVEISGQGIPGWLYRLYDPVYVNAFFFVSGYLLFGKRPSASKMSGNILFRLVIPSVIFATIEFFPKMLIKGGGFSFTSFMADTVGGGTYWFVSALAVAQLLFMILFLTRIRSIWFYVACSVAFAVIGILIEASGVVLIGGDDCLPWCYKQGFVCMLYMTVGGLYQKYEKSMGLSAWLLVLMVTVYLSGNIWGPGFIEGYSVYRCYVTPTGFAWSIFGTICVVETCKRLRRMRVLTFVGRNSILFYMMSGALPTVFTALMGHRMPVNVFLFLLIFILSVAAAYALSAFILRFLPFIKDLRTLK